METKLWEPLPGHNVHVYRRNEHTVKATCLTCGSLRNWATEDAAIDAANRHTLTMARYIVDHDATVLDIAVPDETLYACAQTIWYHGCDTDKDIARMEWLSYTSSEPPSGATYAVWCYGPLF